MLISNIFEFRIHFLKIKNLHKLRASLKVELIGTRGTNQKVNLIKQNIPVLVSYLIFVIIINRRLFWIFYEFFLKTIPQHIRNRLIFYLNI